MRCLGTGLKREVRVISLGIIQTQNVADVTVMDEKVQREREESKLNRAQDRNLGDTNL